jgi:hypothetical protein
MLHDSLTDHLRLLRERHPDVDFVLIEPRPDDEKMFFHEVMSFSAQLIVLQHGYESVVQGLHQSWPYLKRILPAHGIQITRDIVKQKPEEVPVWILEERATLLGRLRQTVLDRRATPPVSTARIASARRRTAAGGAAGKNRRVSGNFRPRVISSEGA